MLPNPWNPFPESVDSNRSTFGLVYKARRAALRTVFSPIGLRKLARGFNPVRSPRAFNECIVTAAGFEPRVFTLRRDKKIKVGVR
jgi:hypothetical protein